MFKPLLDNEELNLVFEEPAGLPRLYTDDRKLSQILRNFISNALKFTARGEVRVSATLEGEDMVCFSVADTGIGIAPEHHERIFEDFRQVDDSPSRQYGGTGLGLAICRRLAAALGGRITLHSTVGQGSSFTLTITVETPQ
jgi:signal transduction histidine kinase